MNNQFSFWCLIEKAINDADGDLLVFAALMEQRLKNLKPLEIKLLQQELIETVAKLSTWENFAAAWLFSGASKKDFFLRYCEWIIIHGQDDTNKVINSPDEVADLKIFNGRWQSVGLISLLTNASRTSGRKSLMTFSDRSLWNVVAEKLECDPTSQQVSKFVKELKDKSPIRPDHWPNLLPKLTKLVNSRYINPAIDRRTPMSDTKFWLIIEQTKDSSDSVKYLQDSLIALPTDQIVEFELIGERYIEAASKLIPILRPQDKELKDLSDTEVAAWIVTLGQSAFQAVNQQPNLWTDLRDVTCRWKGKRLLEAPREAFLEKTGHNYPTLAA